MEPRECMVHRLGKMETTFATQDFAPTLFPGLWRVDGLFQPILDVVTDASLGPGDSLFLCSVLANIFGCLATTILFNSTKWCKKDGNWYHILKTPLYSPKRQNNIYSFHCFDYPCFFSFSRLDFAGDLFVLFRTLDLWVLCFRWSWDNLSIYSNHVFLLTRNLHYINYTNKHSWPKQ